MKRVMMMTVALAVLMCRAETSAPELVATAEIASFGDVTKKVNALGALINNPIVPMLVVSAGQQQLTQTYGAFRSGAPLYLYVYLKPDVLEAALKKNDLSKIDAGKLADAVIVYPSVDGPAKMEQKHPGCMKEADGTLHLLSKKGRPAPFWVKFTEDGRHCAFARSAELARRGIADFAQSAAARKASAAESKLVRIDLTERGLARLLAVKDRLMEQEANAVPADKTDAARLARRVAELQKLQKARQDALLRGLAGVTLLADLNDLGLSFDLRVAAKPGAKRLPAAGFRLPAGAFEALPAGAACFGASNMSLQGGYFAEEEFRAEIAVAAQLLREDVLPEIRKDEGAKKYLPLIEEGVAAMDEFLRAVPYPAAGDWSAAALAFDAGRHPYVVSAGELAKYDESQRVSRRLVDRLAGAFAKQWPGKTMLARAADDTVTVDWGAVVDVAAAESGVAETNAKEVAQAKKTLADVLGGTQTVCTTVARGTKATSVVAAPGFKVPAAKSDAEAMLAAALPEAAKDRPAGLFYCAPYAFVRDVALPVALKFMDKNEAVQVQALLAGLPTAEPNSALAGAGWAGADGSFRLLVRLTANEIRNYGAAFNAYTAASMASETDDEDDK